MIKLAKNAIVSRFTGISLLIPSVSQKLLEKRACFVTLTVNGKLRGCIGHILPIQELYRDIMENAKAAAFDDPRFPPLTHQESDHIDIEISILTVPKPYPSQNSEDLLTFLGREKPGVILSKDSRQATFLPDVWNDLPNPKVFLTHLSLKAGLPHNAWIQEPHIQYYRTDVIKA